MSTNFWEIVPALMVLMFFLFVWICFGIGGFKGIKKSTSNMFKNWGI